MEKSFYPLLLLIIFLSGCHHPKEMYPVLQEMEHLLADRPDSALIRLENLYPGDDFNDYNRACYYILLTEARNKNEISLLESDSLIDFSIKNLNPKRYPGLAAKAYLFKGRLQNELQEPDDAIETFHKGITILEKTDIDPEVLSKLYDELGNVYLYEFIYERALETFRKEYEIDLEIGDMRGIAFSLRNIGSVYLFQENPDSAYHYLNEALEYARQSKDSIYLSDFIHNDIALWFIENKEYEKALIELNRIEKLKESYILNKGEALIRLEQLDSARILLSEVIHSDNIYIHSSAKKFLSEIAEQENDFETALRYRKEYFSAFCSIIKQNKAAEIRIIDHKHNWKIAANKLKEHQKRILIITGFSFFIIVLATMGLLFYLNRKRKAERDERDKEIAHLNVKIALTENVILKQQNTNEQNFLFLEEKRKEKEKLLESLFEIEKNVFQKKKIFNRLLKITATEKENLNKNEMNKLTSAIKESFIETFKQTKQNNQEIKQDQIEVYCLRKLGFTSKEIGRFLNLSESAIRHKTAGII